MQHFEHQGILPAGDKDSVRICRQDFSRGADAPSDPARPPDFYRGVVDEARRAGKGVEGADRSFDLLCAVVPIDARLGFAQLGGITGAGLLLGFAREAAGRIVRKQVDDASGA